jgi:hypothetical protein
MFSRIYKLINDVLQLLKNIYYYCKSEINTFIMCIKYVQYHEKCNCGKNGKLCNFKMNRKIEK